MDFEATFPLRFYLNLSRRQDRRFGMEELCEQHGLSLQRFPAIDGNWVKKLRGYPTSSRYAVALSKRLILRRARNANAESVFFFEDDVTLHPRWREIIKDIVLPDDWQVFFLGCLHLQRPEFVSPGLVRTGFAVDNQAVGIRSSAFQTILKAWSPSSRGPGGKTYSDIEMARHFDRLRAYAVYPNLAWQAGSISDQTGEVHSNFDRFGAQTVCREVVIGSGAEAQNISTWRGFPRPVLSSHYVYNTEGTGRAFKDAGVRTFLGSLRNDSPHLLRRSANPSVAILMNVRSKVQHSSVWEQYLAATDRIQMYQSSLETIKGDEVAGSSDCLRYLRTSLTLLSAALRNGDDYFVLLDEHCAPVMPPPAFLKLLRLDGRPWIDWKTMKEKAHQEETKALEAFIGAPRIPGDAWNWHSRFILLDRITASFLIERDLTGLFQGVPDAETCYAATVLRFRGYPLGDMVTRRSPVHFHKPRYAELAHLVSRHAASELMLAGKPFAGPFSSKVNLSAHNLHLES